MKVQGIIIGIIATLFVAVVTIQLLIVGQYWLSTIFGIMLVLAMYATKIEYNEFKNEKHGK